jgi:hypothetical protein
MADQHLSADLERAARDLQGALEQAGRASIRIRELLPHVERISSVFDELQSVFESGRRSVSAVPAPPALEQTAAALRPTPITPISSPKRGRQTTAQGAAESQPGASEWHIEAMLAQQPVPGSEPAPADPLANEPTTTFRLEFESHTGPLDLRAVDEAVGQHEAVRDVALLDYDGRRATLKVWIAATSSPAEVQATLAERAAQIGGGNDISIVALEDVA